MPTALVTGPTGVLGSALAGELLARGMRVRLFARTSWQGRALPPLPPAPSAGAGRGTRGEAPGIFYGDIRDVRALEDAASGCDIVFHTAAMVSFRGPDRAGQIDVNAGGARAVAEACLRAGVGRLVHTSSIAALGYRTDGGLVDETTPFNWPPSIAYRWSKHLAEGEILDAVGRGLDAVMVNPTVIVGPGDRYVHGGQLVRDAVRGRMIAWPGGGMNVAALPDVVAGHLAAAERGRTGERYILGGTNFTHRELFFYLTRLFGARRPVCKIPRGAVRLLARGAELFAGITGTEPLITPDLVAGVGMYQWCSHRKAARELGYNPVSLEQSLIDTYNWYRENGIL